MRRALLVAAVLSSAAFASTEATLLAPVAVERVVLPAGMVVEVESCDLESCVIRSGELRSEVARRSLGTRRDAVLALASRHGAAMRALMPNHHVATEWAVQAVEALSIREFSGPFRQSSMRAGLVGVTVVRSSHERQVHDAETVTAVCSDGVRQLPVRVVTTPLAGGLTVMSVSVDCDAELVIAGELAAGLVVRPVKGPTGTLTTLEFVGRDRVMKLRLEEGNLWLTTSLADRRVPGRDESTLVLELAH